MQDPLFLGFENLSDEERINFIVDWVLSDPGDLSHSWYINGKIPEVFYENLASKYSDLFEEWNNFVDHSEQKLCLSMDFGKVSVSIEYVSDLGNTLIGNYFIIDLEEDDGIIYDIVEAFYYSKGAMYDDEGFMAR